MSDDPFVGRKVLNRYRIIRRLAKGGMGVIYLARSEGAAGFLKPVVVKRISSDLTGDDSVIQMFAREARIMSNLNHPNIVGVLEFERFEDNYLMVLEYVHGFQVNAWNKFIAHARGLFPADLAVHIVDQVLRALHYAHTLPGADGQPLAIIHRDVTPHNILISTVGHVKLADFGIARMRTDLTSTDTASGTIKGKFSYVSPEQFNGAQPSPQTDVYSAGVVLHELLVGKNEFRSADVMETVHRVMTHVPSRVTTIRRDVPAAIDGVLARALAKNPEERFQTAAEFAEALCLLRADSEDRSTALLQKAANEDFNNPAMAEFLEVEDLGTLERAWRTGHPEPESTRPGRPSHLALTAVRAPQSNNPTAATDKGMSPPIWVETRSHTSPMNVTEQDTAAPPKLRPQHGVKSAVGAVAVLCLVAAMFWALKGHQSLPMPQKTANTPPVIVVQAHDGAPAVQVDAQAAPSPSRAEADVKDAPPAASNAAGSAAKSAARAATRTSAANVGIPQPAAPASGAKALTRTFSKRNSEVLACLQQHSGDLGEQPQLVIRFDIEATGAVDGAGLEPKTLEATGLGRCLLDVARTTSFGPQGGPLSFRIPIAVRRAS